MKNFLFLKLSLVLALLCLLTLSFKSLEPTAENLPSPEISETELGICANYKTAWLIAKSDCDNGDFLSCLVVSFLYDAYQDCLNPPLPPIEIEIEPHQLPDFPHDQTGPTYYDTNYQYF